MKFKNLQVLTFLLISIIFSACGKLKVEGELKQQDPIVIEHVIKIDEKQLALFYENLCIQELSTNATDEELQRCIEDEMDLFKDALNSATSEEN